MAPVPLLLLSGPVGIGKTTLGNEVSMVLERKGTAHTFVDLDGLAATFPRPPDDRFGSRLALTNLRDVWTNCAAAGSRNLIVARVIETGREVEDIERAIPGAQPAVCQLRASDPTLIARIRTRELGAGQDWHEARALELAQSLRIRAPADFTIETDDRSPPEIAEEIVAQVDWVTAG